MDTYRVNELVIRADNKPGLLDKISKSLSSKGINIESIVGYVVGRWAVLRIVTNDLISTKKELEKIDAIDEIKEDELLVVKLEDKPGELSKITDKLNKRGVDLHVLYILSKENGYAHVALKPANKGIDEVLEILG